MSDALKFHAEGLRRISKVIDGDPNYDALLEHKVVGNKWSVFRTKGNLQAKREAALALLSSSLGIRKRKVIVPMFSGICCDGNTRNNINEFKFFESMCSPDIKILNKNYADCAKVKVKFDIAKEARVIDRIKHDAFVFYGERCDISASLVHQQILYSNIYFDHHLAFNSRGTLRPGALVQANDHSPARVALSMIVKGFCVPRIYFQHAEITKSFPALDFEYCVLRNQASLDTYKEIGPIPDFSFVISRSKSSFQKDKLERVRDDGVCVVVYPTARVIDRALRELLINLAGNEKVGKIYVKQHPGSPRRDEDSFSVPGVKVITDYLDQDHIAIVGNSSVVVELLHKGIPVYQNFDFDPVAADYYGFVKAGLTKLVNMCDVLRSFWVPYVVSDDWMSKYVRLDPTADYLSHDDEVLFIKEMMALNSQSSMQLNAFSRPPKGLLRAKIKFWAYRCFINILHRYPTAAASIFNYGIGTSSLLSEAVKINSYRLGRFLSTYTELPIDVKGWREEPAKGLKQGSGLEPTDSLRQVMSYTVEMLPHPVDWLLLLEKKAVMSSGSLMQFIGGLAQDNPSTFSRILEDATTWTPASPVLTWLYLKNMAIGDVDAGAEGFQEIASYVQTFEGADSFERVWIEEAFLFALLEIGSVEQFQEYSRRMVQSV